MSHYQLNTLGHKRIPFFFIIDFAMRYPYIMPLAQLESDVLFSIAGFSNLTKKYDYQPSIAGKILKKSD